MAYQGVGSLARKVGPHHCTSGERQQHSDDERAEHVGPRGRPPTPCRSQGTQEALQQHHYQEGALH
eukprot:7528948-Pyramimonas_sp.AAC.1